MTYASLHSAYLYDFVRQSNAIENIHREPSIEEVKELHRFLNLREITIAEIDRFVSIYQPDAKLRDKYDMNVRVGKYIPPFGGPEIREQLISLLEDNKKGLLTAFEFHIKYEVLHPYMDCNGRSGRALWAWLHKDIKDGFLRPFYYQALQYFSKIPLKETQ